MDNTTEKDDGAKYEGGVAPGEHGRVVDDTSAKQPGDKVQKRGDTSRDGRQPGNDDTPNAE